MRSKRTIFVSALALGAVVAVPASAEIVATAMTPLNVRSGPGPEYSIIDTIPDRGQTTIIGCIRESLWCQVSHKGRQGWAYSQYLTARLSGRSLAVAERLTDIPTVVYQTPVETVGSAVTAPAITGTLVARTVPAQRLVITPPATVRTKASPGIGAGTATRCTPTSRSAETTTRRIIVETAPVAASGSPTAGSAMIGPYCRIRATPRAPR